MRKCVLDSRTSCTEPESPRFRYGVRPVKRLLKWQFCPFGGRWRLYPNSYSGFPLPLGLSGPTCTFAFLPRVGFVAVVAVLML